MLFRALIVSLGYLCFNVKIILLPKQGGEAVTVTKKLFPKRAYISSHFIHA